MVELLTVMSYDTVAGCLTFFTHNPWISAVKAVVIIGVAQPAMVGGKDQNFFSF